MDVRVPEMIIKLKQGIGRLIRNFSDTGIVSIIDSLSGHPAGAIPRYYLELAAYPSPHH